ncbi:MAG: metal-dependent transcriptional regulator [Lachnospiraceae bacterium]|nr:metal-dependent transcriptional regulator [Lachnospiraceae bacterium]
MGEIQESGEMYLETILVLSNKNNFVRSIDVAEYMGFSKPSVSRAMGILKSHEYITVEKDGNLKLTDSGRSIAEKIYERHTVLSECLMKLGVSEKNATDDACRIEHIICDETFDAIKKCLYKNKEA